MCFFHLQIYKNIMSNFFGDFENGAKLALERGDEFEKKNGAQVWEKVKVVFLPYLGSKNPEKYKVKYKVAILHVNHSDSISEAVLSVHKDNITSIYMYTAINYHIRTIFSLPFHSLDT